VGLLKGNPLNKALSLLRMNPQENNLQRLILGRDDINPNDQTISRFHLSIIWDPETKRYYLLITQLTEHSLNLLEDKINLKNSR
jgi:hypothetical protein